MIKKKGAQRTEGLTFWLVCLFVFVFGFVFGFLTTQTSYRMWFSNKFSFSISSFDPQRFCSRHHLHKLKSYCSK